MSSLPKDFEFEDAERIQCKASIVLEGLSGNGKSTTALLIARALSEDWSEIYAVDTENRSLRLLSGIESTHGIIGKFKVKELTSDVGFKPSNYLAIRAVAKRKGAKVFIQDSISHAWAHAGGVLDLVTQAKANDPTGRFKKDSYAAWSDPEVMTEKNKLLDMMRDPDVHVISTVRLKEKMEYSVNEQGKTVLVSLGEQQIQQADLKYEPDLVLQLIKPGVIRKDRIEYPVVRVSKSRYAIFTKDEEVELTPTLLKQLRQYLEEGADPKVLQEQQRLEYVEALKTILKPDPNKQAIADIRKEQLGFKDKRYSELPIEVLRIIYSDLS